MWLLRKKMEIYLQYHRDHSCIMELRFSRRLFIKGLLLLYKIIKLLIEINLLWGISINNGSLLLVDFKYIIIFYVFWIDI
jgi:hypothetical protein